MLLHLLLPFLLSFASLFAPNAPALTGQEVLRKMHAKYQGKFNPYFTFDQKAIIYKSAQDSTEQVWHEALALPGRLVIKFEDFEKGNGAIYAQDSQFVFKDNTLQTRTRRVHEVLVLGFDVYHQPVDRSAAQLQEAGIDLSKAFATVWQSRKVYVVGVNSLEEKASHFIIDQEKLWVLQTVRQTGDRRNVVDLKGYQNVKGNWVATDLTFSLNGKTTMHEVYYNIKFPKTLPANLFTVAGFKAARW
ncbi:outer membrane lipoprotein-sorting protein [Rufibacter hautae]|uniref:Outer membrane lipoprotein-sorting protein n=1 Tax=Rufibacter hautae TaxID=2595005 RepID=A0A5B6TDQ1_9BACT|nr:outer membrane lipoprotein-sorting protein [Rufibacter hautae]KAA3437504.1 outer membrane lipoprotein-sorting protein [Rufibacter hautae]